MSKQTPEGLVKDEVKEYLHSIGCIAASKAPNVTDRNTGYYFMPGGTGFGVSGIPDFVGHYKGQFFGVETKVQGKEPTPLQHHQLKAISVSKGAAFVVKGLDDLHALKRWVNCVDKQF